MSVSDDQVNKDTSQDYDVDAWTDVSFGRFGVFNLKTSYNNIF